MKKIRILVSDVDGSFFSSQIICNEDNFSCLSSIKDGAAISYLKNNNIIPIFISNRKQNHTLKRFEELDVKELYFGCSDKLNTLKKYVIPIMWT